MPLTEIIAEIDAYLSRLHQARHLLIAPLVEKRSQPSPRTNKKIKVTRASAPISKPRILGSKSLPVPPVRERKPEKTRADSIVRSGSIARQAAESEQPEIPATTQDPATDAIRVLPSRRAQSSPIRRVLRKVTMPVIRAKPHAPKAAIALAGPISSKIVVVSAEQAEREREKAAHPAVRRPRPGSGLPGKLAFEALFRNDAD